ncbi:MAG TPA: hypothetical protein VGB71_00670 [Flavisolibacter sp.]|jgi:hypothetical protein
MEHDTTEPEQKENTISGEQFSDTDATGGITAQMMLLNLEEDEDEEPIDNSQD